ncbi:MAG: hypothetical protein JO125_14280, partial [Chloroflexi bacterium]|nr:hypothetical protein [Chloroflexota bacterium]
MSIDKILEGQHNSEDMPLLIVIGSGDQLYREYIMQSVCRRYRLWLLQPEPATWQQPYLVGNTIVDNTN